MIFNYIATTAYALEGVTAKELRELGCQVGDVQTSRVAFSGSALDGCRANLFLRTAGRVRLVIGQFQAQTFDELFEKTYALPWEEYMDRNAAFPVTGRSVKSQLSSIPTCQSIVKKAIATRLSDAYHTLKLTENGSLHAIEIHIWQDQVTLSIDLSGDPLHKRGYRDLNGPAALRETLAAALVLISHWNSERPLLDPFCGTGTIPIEAAMLARGIAPGIGRRFISENMPIFSSSLWAQARQEVFDCVLFQLPLDIAAADIDPQAISMARHHARNAGVADGIRFYRRDIVDTDISGSYGHIITNPPYGERLGDIEAAEDLYADLGDLWRKSETWSCHVISPHDQFERYFGARTKHRRVLYNGPIACRYFQYYGPRPPRGTDDIS